MTTDIVVIRITGSVEDVHEVFILLKSLDLECEILVKPTDEEIDEIVKVMNQYSSVKIHNYSAKKAMKWMRSQIFSGD